MIDLMKLRKDFTKRLHSFSADDLQEWLDMDEKRMALVDMENGLNGAKRINGAAQIKLKGVPIKKTTRAKVSV